MKKFVSDVVPHFSQLLVQRETELRSVLRDLGSPSDEVQGAMHGDVVDFKDIAAEQTVSEVEGVKPDCAVSGEHHSFPARMAFVMSRRTWRRAGGCAAHQRGGVSAAQVRRRCLSFLHCVCHLA